MRMEMVGVLVQRRDIAPDIAILARPKDGLTPVASDGLRSLGIHTAREAQNDVVGMAALRRPIPGR